MAYNDRAQELGRKPCIICKIRSTSCSLTFGVAPCTASSLTGDGKCYNTFGTCQDQTNFTNATTVYNHIEQLSDIPPGYFPDVISVSDAPTRLVTGQGLSYRASVSVTFADFPHHDRGIDPYFADRETTPTGSFWGRWLARNKYYANDTFQILRGYIGDTFSEDDFETYEYLIDRVDRNSQAGTLTFVLKDPLARIKDAYAPRQDNWTLIENQDRANGKYRTTSTNFYFSANVQHGNQFPFYLTDGTYSPIETTDFIAGDLIVYQNLTLLDTGGSSYSVLSSTPTQWTFTTSSGGVFTVDLIISDQGFEDGATVRVKIGDEIIEGTYTTTGVMNATRGVAGTTAATYEAGETVTPCYWVQGENVVDVISDLLVNYSGIATTYLDDYTNEQNKYLTYADCSATIPTPTKVNELISELCQAYMLDVWFDERSQKIKIRSGTPHIDQTVVDITDDQLLSDRLEIKRDFANQATRVFYRYNIKDVTDDGDSNWFNEYVIASPVHESSRAYDRKRTKVIKNRWSTDTGNALAVSSRYVARYLGGEVTIDLVFDAGITSQTLTRSYIFGIDGTKAIGGKASAYGFTVS
jgi:hypothetical protein